MTFKWILYSLLLLLILINLFIILSGRFYIYKGIANTYLRGRSGPSIYDRDIFAYTTLKKSNELFVWNELKESPSLSDKEKSFMNSMRTTSFLVFKGDSLIHETYSKKHDQKTVSNSFSAAKTFVALLIGIAHKEGKINSLDEPIGNYIDSYQIGKKKKITIRHLLMMASGLNWQESGKNPLSENAESYYGTDLRGLVHRQRVCSEPGKEFNYQSGNSQLLGFILEKGTSKSLSEYAYEKIWSKIGTENDAYWSLDKEGGNEKSFCCLYGTSRDFGRLGRLIKKQGDWDGNEVIDSSFMESMIKNPKLSTQEKIPNYRYGLHIWTYLGGENPVYYCRGILGQYIITIPNEDIVIVRTGFERKDIVVSSLNPYEVGHPSDLFTYISIAKRLISTLKK
jgi:CubicO group peptidase (beta-lactamase class C family)